jgi:hypothetical protein
MAHEFYADNLSFAGRTKEAIPKYQKAIRLNPIGSSMANTILGT